MEMLIMMLLLLYRQYVYIYISYILHETFPVWLLCVMASLMGIESNQAPLYCLRSLAVSIQP